jgi:hypothetical protein
MYDHPSSGAPSARGPISRASAAATPTTGTSPIIIFLVIAFWAFRPRNKKRFEKDARIPLDDDR